MSDRQVSFLLDEFLLLKERISASEVKNGQLESQNREAQEKNAQLEDQIKELQNHLRDLTQLINEEKVGKQIDFNDLLNYNDSELDSQNGPQIDPIREDILAGLKERIRNLEEKNNEFEKKFQHQNFDEPTIHIDSGINDDDLMKTSSFTADSDSTLMIEVDTPNPKQVEVASEDSGINDDYLMKTDSDSTLMIEVDTPKQVEVASEGDFKILNETMLDNDNGSTSNFDLGPKKENGNLSESFSIIYESLKEENSALKTNRVNQYAKKFKKRSVLSHLPPNSSILRPATNRPNYQDILNGVDSGEVVPSHTCILCSKSFKKRSNLVAHTVRMHSGTNPTFGPGYCSKCSKSFKNSRGLKLHQIFLHSGKEQQNGSVPEAVQSTSSSISTNLENQNQTIETEVIPFNCLHCDIKFRLKSQLKNHLKIHTNIKKTECLNCYKVFKTKLHLIKHFKTQCQTPKM